MSAMIRAALLAALALPGCVGERQPPPEKAAVQTEALYSIKGMTCDACARRVKDAIEALPGVVGATVRHAQGEAKVQW